MRSDHQIFLHKMQIFLTIAVGLVPAPVLLFANYARQLLGYTWIFPAIYMILALLSLKASGKWRILYGIVGVCVLLLPGLFLQTASTVAFISGGLYGLVLMLSLQIAGWSTDREIPAIYAGCLLVLHLFAQYTIHFDTAHKELLRDAAFWLTASLFLVVALVLLSLNRSCITVITHKRQGSFSVLRGKNALLTIALFGVALIGSLLPSLLRTVVNGLKWVIDGIVYLLSLLEKDEPIIESVPETTLPSFDHEIQLPPIDYETNQIVYIILAVSAFVILVPIVVYLLIKTWKVLKIVIHFLLHWFQKMLINASEAYYEDEITDTRDDPEQGKFNKRRNKRLKSLFMNEQKMTTKQRIRHRYQRLSITHKEWKSASTARENLPLQAAEIYERARYSNHPMSEEDALQFKSKTKGI